MKTIIRFLICVAFVFLCACENEREYYVDYNCAINYSTNQIEFNQEEYELLNQEGYQYTFLQFRDIYRDRLNFMVLKEYEGLNLYRTDSTYVYDLNTNKIHNILSNLDKNYHMWSFIYLGADEYLYCIVDLTKSREMFTYYVIYEKEKMKTVLNSGKHYDIYAAPILTVQDNKIYYFVERFEGTSYFIELYEFKNGNSKILISKENLVKNQEISKMNEYIVDYTPQVSESIVSFRSKNEDGIIVNYYEGETSNAVSVGNARNALVFKNVILCIESKNDEHGRILEISAQLISKHNKHNKQKVNIGLIFDNYMMMSDNSMVGVSNDKLYYLFVNDTDCKIEITEVDLNHKAVYCRKIDNKSVLVFGEKDITRVYFD